MGSEHATDTPAVPAPELCDEAYVVALSSLPAVGPARLRLFLSAFGPALAWQRARAGSLLDHPKVAPQLGVKAREAMRREWSEAMGSIDPGERWRRCTEAGIGVVRHGGPGYPAVLAGDIEPPTLLYVTGDPLVIRPDRPRVAVVGTRTCTRYGSDVARRLGRELAGAGVSVVSGLAAGIDAAAHVGALEAHGAPPVAVVGTGLDVVYPRRSAALWRQVAQRGVVVGESPPGAPPDRWRFPARNRIVAALADVVVVVESGASGGSLITVDEAERRDRDVMAVPGPVTSPASDGTNGLLVAGVQPALDADHVLGLLGLAASSGPSPDPRPVPCGLTQQILDSFGWRPAALAELVDRSDAPVDEVVAAVERLVADGWVSATGPWYERVHDPHPRH